MDFVFVVFPPLPPTSRNLASGVNNRCLVPDFPRQNLTPQLLLPLTFHTFGRPINVCNA